MPDLVYRTGTAGKDAIYRHLCECSRNFTPPLDERVDLADYSRKLAENAITFEAWHKDSLVGLVAAYFNDVANKRGFVTSVSTAEKYMGRGISKTLMQRCIDYGQRNGFLEMSLAVNRACHAALALYRACGFAENGIDGDDLVMKRSLAEGR